MKKITGISFRPEKGPGKQSVTPEFQAMIRKAIFRLSQKDFGIMAVMKSSWILGAVLIAESPDSES